MLLASIFIPFIVIAIVQFLKIVAPKISGALTIIVAVIVGIVCSLLANVLGLAPVSIAEGIILGLTAAGIHTAASAVNTSTS
jgi:hypothetical protein